MFRFICIFYINNIYFRFGKTVAELHPHIPPEITKTFGRLRLKSRRNQIDDSAQMAKVARKEQRNKKRLADDANDFDKNQRKFKRARLYK